MLLPPAALGLAALATAALAAPGPADALAALLHPAALPPAALLVAALGLTAQAGAAWVLLVALLTLGARVPSAAGRACRGVLQRCAPAGLRRAVAMALGAGLALGLAPPAAAAGAPAPTAAPTTAPSTASDTDLPPLDWPGLAPAPTTPAPTPPAPPTPAPPEAASQTAASPTTLRAAGSRAPAVVVRPGDTLWDLAGRSLPPPVSDADRAAEWPRWWAANRDVVGDDPDLLLPGQRLVAPPTR